jgi:hypothetical protein
VEARRSVSSVFAIKGTWVIHALGTQRERERILRLLCLCLPQNVSEVLPDDTPEVDLSSSSASAQGLPAPKTGDRNSITSSANESSDSEGLYFPPKPVLKVNIKKLARSV